MVKVLHFIFRFCPKRSAFSNDFVTHTISRSLPSVVEGETDEPALKRRRLCANVQGIQCIDASHPTRTDSSADALLHISCSQMDLQERDSDLLHHCSDVDFQLASQCSDAIIASLSLVDASQEYCQSFDIRNSNEERIRRFYKHCVKNDHCAIFQKLALPLKEALLQSEQGSNAAKLLIGQKSSINIWFDGSLHVFEQEQITIGRLPDCDVSLHAKSKWVSRLHVWILNFPGGIVVIDGWSLHGTAVANEIFAGQESPSSVPNARRGFVIPHGQPVILKVGYEFLVLNPKLCCVCLEHPRVQLICGHQALCSFCASREEVTKCPLCRTPFEQGQVPQAWNACIDATMCTGNGAWSASRDLHNFHRRRNNL
eukprot:CAMPEP_0169205030 /NCGR_PEP_ID=MMETSP1016-20121227/12303_1 /TAXON_ID=342587 /ORGANISM="Karlodinium micrum, Strain CCMP2283" /LENGTH=369 /DNA_ID=CAMNT_0009282155 /DNA_START=5 /DNA_END=1114 /DNA_ORIENTATION=+